jgi:hypothetical protein
MKNKILTKTKIATILALFLSANAVSETKYLYVLGDKTGSYNIVDTNGEPVTPPVTPPEGAGDEVDVPVSGYDFLNLEVGTFSSFLRAPDQTTVFYSGETFTFGTGYTVSGTTTDSTENDTLYLDLLGLKTTYNSSTFQLEVSSIDSIAYGLTIPAQKSGTILSSNVQESFTISYDSSGDTINLNGSVANGTKVFNSTAGLYMDYAGDADSGNFTFSSPVSISKGTHSIISYTTGENTINFSSGDYLSFNNGFNNSGTLLQTTSEAYYLYNGSSSEGMYIYDNNNKEITFSLIPNYGTGNFKAMQSNDFNFGLPNLFMKTHTGKKLKIQFDGSQLTSDIADDQSDGTYDCITTSPSCTIQGFTFSYDSGSNSFIIN